MASGVQVAISMSNTGGAWDNAKKYIERATPDSDLQGKGSDIHKVGGQESYHVMNSVTDTKDEQRLGRGGGSLALPVLQRLTATF